MFQGRPRAKSRPASASARPFLALVVAAVAASLLFARPESARALLPRLAGVVLPGCEADRVLTLRTPPLRGDDVTELQLTLQGLGLFDGAISGLYDPPTSQAVRDIRSRHGLPPTDRTDAAFWKALEEDWMAQTGVETAVPVSESSPPPGERLIVINIETVRLTLYIDGRPWKSYPVAVGKPSTPSAVGQWYIRNKAPNVGGPFGSRWMGLSVPWGIYGIHGTNNPGSIGSHVSGGCIRMFNWNVEELYEWVEVGTPVHIVAPHWPANVPASLPEGSVGLGVVFLQWQMLRNGFKPGSADGRLGEVTRNSIKDVEAFYGLRADGLADTDVLCLLDLDR